MSSTNLTRCYAKLQVWSDADTAIRMQLYDPHMTHHAQNYSCTMLARIDH